MLKLLIIVIIVLGIVNLLPIVKEVSNVFTKPSGHNTQQSETIQISQRSVLQASAIDIAKYSQSPFFLPTPTESIQPSAAQIALGNTVGAFVNDYQPYLRSLYDDIYVDPFLSAIWTVAVEGIASPYFWNCLDTSVTNDPNDPGPINAGCHDNGDIVAFNSGNWQVGYGIQVSQAASHIANDFDAVYGDGKANDAAFVQSIGQAIIDGAGITNPSTFPNQTLTSLVEQAGSQGTPETSTNAPARQALAILLMDPKLGAVAVAREIAGDIQGGGDNWRATMEGWHPSYINNMQTFSNRMAGMAENYTGVATGGTGTSTSGRAGGGSLPPITLKVRLKPETQDTYILNKAVATAIGGTGGGASGSTGGSGLPGQPLPEGDVADIAQVLCDEYDVCATASTVDQPDQNWSMAQITALWNVIQKIQKTSTYKAYAIGNNILEVSRAACYPGGCDDTWGYYAGQDYAWATIPGSRVVIVTDNVPKDGTNDKLEWLIAHEIGHGASGGNAEGDIPQCLSCNETAKAVLACNTPVSNYSVIVDDNGKEQINTHEYVAEAISYYMTNAEAVNEGYRGASGNMKDDFPCIYNALKDGYFDGVEY